ncbi:MAG: hypothetical protein M3N13_11180 [Candidatus Eremiobacteraeota bacterium]|nr:hypothetical protein [Candidatus Eremiobacteraeota bacterium]
MKRVIDTTVPFIAIREDVSGSSYDPTMGEYLCNPLDEDLSDVRISTSGFFSADSLGVISSEPHDTGPFDLPAGEARRFALSTDDEYDEMVVSWTVRYRTPSRGVVTESFGSYKCLKDTEYHPDVPALGGPALIVPRSMA